jgi:uncharacterized membrane protein YfcA
VIAYYRAGKLRIPVAALVGAGLLFGAWAGAQIALQLPTSILRQLSGVFLLYAAWRFIEPRKSPLAEARGQRPPAPIRVARDSFPPLLLFAVGLGAGVISGLFGVGGGIVIVPALVGLLHFDQKLAVGTSLAALLLPVSAARGDHLPPGPGCSIWRFAALAAAGGLVGGAFIGAKIALGLPSSTIKRPYGISPVAVGLRYSVRRLRRASAPAPGRRSVLGDLGSGEIHQRNEDDRQQIRAAPAARSQACPPVGSTAATAPIAAVVQRSQHQPAPRAAAREALARAQREHHQRRREHRSSMHQPVRTRPASAPSSSSSAPKVT